jgi:ligand-binding SRPBCC domain-containing protein
MMPAAIARDENRSSPRSAVVFAETARIRQSESSDRILGAGRRSSIRDDVREANDVAEFRLETVIAAPIDRCFDLARDIDFHVRSLAHTGERAVAGRTTGLIELGESVTWEARHLGVRQRLTSSVTAFDRPHYFRDVMTAGAFQAFAHEHWFEARDGRTIMTDVVEFKSPFGPLGRLVDAVFMKGYLRRLLGRRCQAILREAESASKRVESSLPSG